MQPRPLNGIHIDGEAQLIIFQKELNCAAALGKIRTLPDEQRTRTFQTGQCLRQKPLFSLADENKLAASQLGKFIGPAGLALIAGSSNFVSPQATADALIPAMNYFAAWYLLALVAVLFIGFETRGRTIDEIDSALTAQGPVAAPVKATAV